MIPRSEEVLSPTIIAASSQKDPRSTSTTFPTNYRPSLFPPSPESSEEEGASVSEGTDEEEEETAGEDRENFRREGDSFNPDRRRSSAATAVPSTHHRYRHFHSASNSISDSTKELLTPWEMQDDPSTMESNAMETINGEGGSEFRPKDPKTLNTRRSNQSLRLDLEGLDLGARPEEEFSSALSPSSISTSASIPNERYFQQTRQAASSSSNLHSTSDRSSFNSSRPTNKTKNSFHGSSNSQVSSPPRSSMSSFMDRSSARSNNPFPNQNLNKSTKDLDSFTAHLREQCVDSREIMGMGEESRNQNQVSSEGSSSRIGSKIGTTSPDGKHSFNSPTSPSTNSSKSPYFSKLSSPESESQPQLLGGFASLGIAPWAGVLSSNQNKEAANSPSGESAPGSTSRSASRPATPRSDQIGTSSPSNWSGVGLGFTSDSSNSNMLIKSEDLSSSSSSSCWGKLLASNRDPMEMFEIISIDEMGQHSIDVGSAEDWEGWSLGLESELQLVVEKGQRKNSGWEVARSMKRQRKWIVAPSEALLPSAEDLPTLNPSSITPEQVDSSSSASDAALRTIVISDHPSSRKEVEVGPSPFSGKAHFELRFLKAGNGSPDRTIVLASPQVHRDSIGGSQSRSTIASSTSSPSISGYDNSSSVFMSHPLDQRASAQFEQRRDPSVSSERVKQLRKTRSRPALRGPASRADDFAPSLPGGPNDRGLSDGVSWPSARRGSDLPPAVVARMQQLRSSSPPVVELESRRPSLGKSNSHESLGVTTPKPTTTAALVAAGVRGNRQSLPPTNLYLPSQDTESSGALQSSDENFSKTSASSSVNSSPSLTPFGLSSLNSYSIPSALPSEGKSPFEDYSLFMDPPKRSYTTDNGFSEPSPRSSAQISRPGQLDPLDPASSHLPVEWNIEASRVFPSLSKVETSPAIVDRVRETKSSSSASSGLQMASSPSNLNSSNKFRTTTSTSAGGLTVSSSSTKKDKRLSDWFKKKVHASPTITATPTPLPSSSKARPSAVSPSAELPGSAGGFQSPFAYSISTLEGEFDLDRTEVLKSPDEKAGFKLENENALDKFSRRPDTAPESPSSTTETFTELQRSLLKDPHRLNQRATKVRTLSNVKSREEEMNGFNGRKGGKRMISNENQTHLQISKNEPSSESERAARRRSVKRGSLHEDDKAILSSIGKIHNWPEKPRSSKSNSSRPSKNSIIASSEISRAQILQQAERSRQIMQIPDPNELDLSFLGLDGISNQALTMLLPLPLFACSNSEESYEQVIPSRYLRISFIPFAASTPSPQNGFSSSLFASTSSIAPTVNQDSATRSHSHSHQHHSHSHNSSTPHGLGLMRKFALAARDFSSNSASNSSSSGSSGIANYQNTQSNNINNSVETPQSINRNGREKISSYLEYDRCRLPTRRQSCIEAFRITAMVLESPLLAHEGQNFSNLHFNPSLPDTTSFPLVLGICDCERGLELVPEGWEALNLANGPADINARSNHQMQDPMAGIADLIMAASVAIMDL